jgi:hypothetical protein
MLIETEKPGVFTAGALDILCILEDQNTGRFHVAFFEEHPMPGPVPSVEETNPVRLKSRMHHTAGADTLEGAQQHLRELREQIVLPDANVCDTPIDWNGEIGIVWLVENWVARGETFADVMRGKAARG